METINFIKEYWVQLVFVIGFLISCLGFAKAMIESVKCSLRNDILDIYDRCKDKKEITRYQLQSIKHSYDVYKKLKGNSFVKDIVEKVNNFKVVD